MRGLTLYTLEEARRIINLYLRRWDIEVFHRVLKTGCRVESIQFKTGQALINSVMIYAVIAWRILYLTHLGRQCPARRSNIRIIRQLGNPRHGT